LFHDRLLKLLYLLLRLLLDLTPLQVQHCKLRLELGFDALPPFLRRRGRTVLGGRSLARWRWSRYGRRLGAVDLWACRPSKGKDKSNQRDSTDEWRVHGWALLEWHKRKWRQQLGAKCRVAEGFPAHLTSSTGHWDKIPIR
jgi:hypothetical protein